MVEGVDRADVWDCLCDGGGGVMLVVLVVKVGRQGS